MLKRAIACYLWMVFIAVPCLCQQSPTEIERRVDSILSRMTLEEKVDMIGGVRGFDVREYPNLGLPALKMTDGPLGVRNGPSSTMGGIELAATWDPELAERVGKVFGEDARARGFHFLLGPGVNIHRAPMNGRNFEYMGEDPFLAAHMAVPYIRGVQSQGVIATIKHYVANNSEYNRHNIDSEIDERSLREIYLPSFEAAVKEARVGAIMDSYNLVNGEHSTQNPFLNIQVAKKDWGFDGIIMSDWDATYDGVAAANAGLDLEMPSGKFMNRQTLLPAIQQGKVTTATIDDKVRRILRQAIRFGFLEHPQTSYTTSLLNPEGLRVARQVAREGIVLLKNDGNILPLDSARVKTIAVIGPDGYPGDAAGGGSAHAVPFHTDSYLEGLTARAGEKAVVLYERGLRTYQEIAGATEFVTENGERGLHAEYFSSADMSGSPVRTEVAQHINSGADDYEAPLPNLAVRWTGYYVAKTAGVHYLFLQGAGESSGARLYIDDKLALDDWEQRTAALDFTSLQLESGSRHKIRVEYKRNQGWGPKRLSFGVLPAAEAVSEKARAAASKADVVFVFAGFNAPIETESADRTFRLPPGQDELIHEIVGANHNTVVVLTAGGNVDMQPWIGSVPALMHAWYSGEEAGDALADLVFGDYSPSGRLPITLERRWEDNASFKNYYPNDGALKVKYSEGVFVGYRHFEHDNIRPQFPFGYGLSYTTFAYKNLSVTPHDSNMQQPVTVSFDITNTGRREGAEVAQLYIGEAHARVPRPSKELKGFARVSLKPGETRRVSISFDRRALSWYDVNAHDWHADAGEFQVLVGKSVDDIQLTGKFTLQ